MENKCPDEILRMCGMNLKPVHFAQAEGHIFAWRRPYNVAKVSSKCTQANLPLFTDEGKGISRFSTIVYKYCNFCDVLFVFLHTKII